jgi:hypothetical protein
MAGLGWIAEAEQKRNLFENHVGKTLMNTDQILHIKTSKS